MGETSCVLLERKWWEIGEKSDGAPGIVVGEGFHTQAFPMIEGDRESFI